VRGAFLQPINCSTFSSPPLLFFPSFTLLIFTVFQFDETLRGKDPSWGIRDMEAIAEVAENEARLKHVQTIDMPSNNYLLIFEKVA